MRKSRKDEHIEEYLKTTSHGTTLFEDVYIEPSSFPELSLREIDTSSVFFGKKTSFPLMINAMTGGTEMTEEINRDLSLLANEFGLPMQVGSQRQALEEREARSSYSIVRSSLGPDHVVLGNLGGLSSIEDVEQALDMIKADGIGLHINPSQEVVMLEGDRDFRGLLDNVKTLIDRFGKKIIVKEVGFGFSIDAAKALHRIGAKIIDVSGAGGTNFLEIEDLRNLDQDYSDFYSWGIPTAKSLINVRKFCPDAFIISSGGIRHAEDILKSFVLGANYCAISGELLRFLLMGGYSYAQEYLANLIDHTKKGMFLLGCRNLEDLKNKPYVLTGKLKEICKDGEL